MIRFVCENLTHNDDKADNLGNLADVRLLEVFRLNWEAKKSEARLRKCLKEMAAVKL